MLRTTVTSGVVPVPDIRHNGEVRCAGWEDRKATLDKWDDVCSNTFRDMKACAFCAKVKFNCCRATSAKYHNFCKIWPPVDADVPPGALTNDILYPLMVNDDGRWNVCQACKIAFTRALRLRHVGVFHPDYTTSLLTGDPTHPLMLSVVHCNVRFVNRVMGFLHTQAPFSPYLLRGPLVHWQTCPPVRSLQDLPANLRYYESTVYVVCPPHVECLLHTYRCLFLHNLANNPLMARYKMVVEVNNGAAGVPIVPSSIIDEVLAESRARGPVMPQRLAPEGRILDASSDVEEDATDDDCDEVCG